MKLLLVSLLLILSACEKNEPKKKTEAPSLPDMTFASMQPPVEPSEVAQSALDLRSVAKFKNEKNEQTIKAEVANVTKKDIIKIEMFIDIKDKEGFLIKTFYFRSEKLVRPEEIITLTPDTNTFLQETGSRDQLKKLQTIPLSQLQTQLRVVDVQYK